ncbi:MAG: hypothetical protein ACK56F_32655, partial [bacterium]
VERFVSGQAGAQLALHRIGFLAQLPRALVEHHDASHHGHQGRSRGGRQHHAEQQGFDELHFCLLHCHSLGISSY